MSETEKYIIEIEEGKDGVMFCQSGIVSIGLHLKDEERLRGLGIRSAIPYTEPDLDAIRKKAYEEGLNAAWSCARKISNMDCFELESIFGASYWPFAGNCEDTPQWCIERIRQYEKKEEELDGLRQNIQTIVDKCGYTLDEIATVLAKMKEES